VAYAEEYSKMCLSFFCISDTPKHHYTFGDLFCFVKKLEGSNGVKTHSPDGGDETTVG